MSAALTAPAATGESLARAKLAACATGASFVPTTVMDNEPKAAAPCSSETVYGTDSTTDWPTPSAW